MLTTAYSMANSGNQQITNESIKFLDELKSKNEVLNMPVYSSNPIINAVIYDKNSTAAELNIDFEIHLDIPQDMDIALTDLCSVFSNLIDNAFKAAEKSNNKKVILTAWSDIGYLFVKTKNYSDNADDLLSKKKHSLMDEHGYGIEIMKDIAEKYDGEFNIQINGNCVNAACSMRYVNPKQNAV
ncbi:MAG: sensor histidine kinase [Porcipelethomonas sp.]